MKTGRLFAVLVTCVAALMVRAQEGLSNLSFRVSMVPGDMPAIAGLSLRGGQPQRIFVRAVGPGLRLFNLTSTMFAPSFTIYGGNTPLLRVSDPDGGDSALDAVFSPASYTFVMSNESGGGLGMLEIYRVFPTTDLRAVISNMSCLGPSHNWPNGALIGGFTTTSAHRRILIRAVGPSLSRFGISDASPDPSVTLYDMNKGQIAMNDDWKGREMSGAATQTGAFSLPEGSKDAALVADLPSGSYSFVVGGSPGTVLIEVYDLDPL